MKKIIHLFLSENTPEMKLARTIFQGVIGVIVSHLDVIFGHFIFNDVARGVITALVMAILTPILAVIGKGGTNE